MDKHSISELDPRASWHKLPKFLPEQVSKKIEISDEDLKTLCHQPCSVLMFKFNVLDRISSAYVQECKELDEIPDEKERQNLFITKGMKVYKKFYEPRLKWFKQQREYLRHLRQEQTIKKVIGNKQEKKKAASASNNILSDSLPDFDSTHEFISFLINQPSPYQSSKIVGESIDDDRFV